jgi:hypothetical protein
MPTRIADEPTARVAQAYLEHAYFEQYLKGLGYSFKDLEALPVERAKALMRDASPQCACRRSRRARTCLRSCTAAPRRYRLPEGRARR